MPPVMRAAPPPQARHHFASCALLAAVCGVLYGRTLSFDFVSYDDFTYIVTNPHLRQGLGLDGLKWAFTDPYFVNYIPLTLTSYLIDYSLFGPNPAGFHATNLVLHLVNSVLLYFFLVRATARLFPSALVALLFAVHPLHVESVAWVSSRKDLLCTTMWFLSLLLYVRYAAKPTVATYTLFAAAFLLGLLSKIMILTLPLQLLLLDVWPLARQRERSWRRLVVEKVPLIALAAAFGLLTLRLHDSSGLVAPVDGATLPLRVQLVLAAYSHYLSKSLWPFDLMPYYPRLDRIPWGTTLVQFTLLLALSAAAWRWRTRFPYWFTGWFWFLVTLLPVAGIIQDGEALAADRYTDVALIGLYIAAAFSLVATATGPRRRTAVAVLAVGACTLLALRTAHQATMWKNSETLYTRMLDSDPTNKLALENLAQYYFSQNRKEEAAAVIQRAILAHPDSARVRVASALSLQDRGLLPDALSDAELAVQLDPQNEPAHVLRARLAEQTAGPDAARSAFAESLAALPDSPGLATAYGEFQLRSREPRAAMATLQDVILRFPNHAQARARLGDVFIREKRFAEAEECYREALRLGDNDPNVWSNRAYLALNRGDRENARLFANKALALFPEHREAVLILRALEHEP